MHIEVDHVTKRFCDKAFLPSGGIEALDNVSLNIAPGEIVVVLGANGAGKTTLLRSLAGLAVPTTGEIRMDGERLERRRLDLRRRLMWFDAGQSYPDAMTVLRQISLLVSVYQAQRPGLERQVVELLQEFGILPLIDQQLQRLSRGQRVKATLVSLLAVDPELWLIDEPFASGMDPEGLEAFRRHARLAADRGRTIVYTTQILEVAERLADRVCILQAGKVVAYDSIERLRRQGADSPEELTQIYKRLSDAAS